MIVSVRTLSRMSSPPLCAGWIRSSVAAPGNRKLRHSPASCDDKDPRVGPHERLDSGPDVVALLQIRHGPSPVCSGDLRGHPNQHCAVSVNPDKPGHDEVGKRLHPLVEPEDDGDEFRYSHTGIDPALKA